MESNIYLSVSLSPELRLEQAFIEAGVENPASVTKLTISGTMTDDDFLYIRENMAETLQELDLSQIIATVIEDLAFENCTALTSITIPGSVKEMRGTVFEGCDSLTSINITISATLEHFFPNEDEWFSIDALCEHTEITYIYVHPDNQIYASENGVLFNKDKTVLFLYPKGREGEYIIPDSVTEIADRAFTCCDSLTLITIPHSVVKIGNDAFFGCTSLTSLFIPHSVVKIGNEAFDHCQSLTSLTIPESVKEIGYCAFRDCYSLTSVVVPESIVTFFHDIFTGCIELYDSVQKLEELILAHWKVAGEKVDKRLERLLYTRKEKINSAFTWTPESKARLLLIDHELVHCFKMMRDKALAHLESLQKNRNRIEVKVGVFIYTPDKEGILREPDEGIERILIDSLQSSRILTMDISDDTDEIRYIKESFSYNKFPTWKRAFEDDYISRALVELDNDTLWSIPDILKINRLLAEVPIVHQYIKEV